MFLIDKFFGQKEKPIVVGGIEVLIHTDAAYFGAHGRMLASNRELGIIEKPVIFCLKGFSAPLPLNHRLFAHIWESFLAQGFVPLELINYGNVVGAFEQEVDQSNNDQGRHQAVHQLPPAQGTIPFKGRAAASLTAAEAGQLDTPAFARAQAGADVGFKSAGFDHAAAAG